MISKSQLPLLLPLAIVGILAFSLMSVTYAQSVDCINGTQILFEGTVFRVLNCLDDKIDAGGGGNVTEFDDLSDVFLVGLVNGQIAVYNATSGQWENEAQAAGSDTTICNNVGLGYLLCAGNNVDIKTIAALEGIQITNDTNTVYIKNNGVRSDVAGVGITVNQTTGNVLIRTNFANGTGIQITGASTQTFTNTGVIANTAGSGISVNATTGAVRITNTSPESTVCSNGGPASATVEVICINNTVKLMALLEGANIAMSNNGTHITFAVTGITSEGTDCTSAGGTTIIKTSGGGDCDFKGLAVTTGLTLTANTNDNNFKTNFVNGTGIQITGSGAQTFTNLYVCTSAGGTTLIKTSTTGSSCDLKGLTAGAGITITSNTNDNQIKTNFANGTGILITGTSAQTFANQYTCTSAGGTSWIKTNTQGSNCDLKGLTVTSPIVLTSNTNDLNVSCPTCATSSSGGMPVPSTAKWGRFTPITTTLQGEGLLTQGTLDGTEAFDDDADGVRMSTTTGTTAGGEAGFDSTFGKFHREWNAKVDARVSHDKTSGERLFVGFTTVVTMPNTDTPCANASCAGFLIRTSDSNYQMVVNDGDASQDVTDFGTAETTSVIRFTVRFDAANNRVGFSINGGAETFVSTEIPAATTDLFMIANLETSDTTSDTFEYYYLYVEQDK